MYSSLAQWILITIGSWTVVYAFILQEVMRPLYPPPLHVNIKSE